MSLHFIIGLFDWHSFTVCIMLSFKVKVNLIELAI